MTDNKIIKALECCKRYEIEDCKECPYYTLGHGCLTKCFEGALDLINRQKAEIERLEKKNEYRSNYMGYFPKLERAEAIKEFAERLKELQGKISVFSFVHGTKDYVPIENIDNIVKEMTEETK